MTSLYDTLQRADRSFQQLTLSPSTFKSIINSVFGLLQERNVPATVIAKLPREAIWYRALDCYRQSLSCDGSIYLFKPQTRKAHRCPTPLRQAFGDSATATGLGPVAPTWPRNTDVWLPTDNPLRRDFFVLILSPELQGILLIHRLPKGQSKSTTGAANMDSSADVQAIATAQNYKMENLRSLQSFDPLCVQLALEAISQYVESLPTENPSDLAPGLEHWRSLCKQIVYWQPNPGLLTSLWAQQLHHQDQLWRSNTVLRPQAEAAEQLELRNYRLASTLELKNEFSKRLGQELRAPLSSIKTALSILGTQALKPPQQQRYIDMLTRECDRQSALISSVLDLVQLDEMTDFSVMEPVSLIDVVPGVVSTYQPLAQEKGVMLAYTISDNLPPVACLTPWLKQIVINLLHNSIKFTPQNGRVWVTAYVKADCVQLKCQDTGIGIAPADIPNVFERFYRVRSPREDTNSGVGLGLSIVQELLLKCGGTVRVTSRLKQGSTFYVSLPIYQMDECP